MDEMPSRRTRQMEMLMRDFKPTEEEKTEILGLLCAPGNVKIEDSPAKFVDFPPSEDSNVMFTELPRHVRESLDRLSLSAKLYLSGFVMIDPRSTDERDKFEKEIQDQRFAVFDRVYAWSKLRRNAMTKIAEPLEIAKPEVQRVKDRGPQYQALLKLALRIPQNLREPYQERVLNEATGEMTAIPVTPYAELRLDEKREIMYMIEDIALDYLKLMSKPEGQVALAAISEKIVAARKGREEPGALAA